MKRNAAFFAAFIIFGLIALFWGNLTFARRSPGGPDLLNHWIAMREFIFHGKSPYSEEVSVKIQHAIYGRAALPGENQYLDVYPLYASLVTFTPFALIGDFTLARALWMTVLELAILASTLLIWRILRWKPKPALAAAVIFFALTWYFAVRAIVHGNAIALVLFWLSLSLYALWADLDGWAGVALVFATVKPNVALLPVIFLLLWTASHRRWRFWRGFFVTLGVLLAFSLWLLPSWPLENLRNILAYPSYNPPASPQATLAEAMPGIGAKLGWALVGIVWLLLLAEWAAAWKRPFRHALWTFSATLLFSIWSGIQTAPGNQLILWISLLVVWVLWEVRWKPAGVWAVWITLVGLWIGLWAFFLATLGRDAFGHPFQSPWMYFPLGIFLFIGLYWVRWWAVRPPLLSELLSDEA